MPKQPAEPSLTAFPQTEAALKSKLTRAPFHLDSLRRPLARCDLQHCKGMCCYDGIYLSAEEAAVLKELARTHAGFFRDIGLELPPRVVVSGSWEGQVAGPKTAVVPRPFSLQVEGFPAHFNDTACVFHLPDGRCGLQVLSEACGQHPWHYKPTGCWLHPLTTDYNDQPGLGLHDEATDPCRLPHYDGFCARTFCGRTVEGGTPAPELLQDELHFLGRIVGRDFVAEIGDRGTSIPRSSPTGD